MLSQGCKESSLKYMQGEQITITRSSFISKSKKKQWQGIKTIDVIHNHHHLTKMGLRHNRVIHQKINSSGKLRCKSVVSTNALLKQWKGVTCLTLTPQRFAKQKQIISVDRLCETTQHNWHMKFMNWTNQWHIQSQRNKTWEQINYQASAFRHQELSSSQTRSWFKLCWKLNHIMWQQGNYLTQNMTIADTIRLKFSISSNRYNKFTQ